MLQGHYLTLRGGKDKKLERGSKDRKMLWKRGMQWFKNRAFGSGHDNGVVVVVNARKLFCSERFYL